MNHPDDEFQLRELRLDSAEAFNVLYDRYSKIIYRKVVNMVKNIPLAEELTQDVFVRVWDKRKIIDASKPFAYYILTIATHTVSDFYRKAARDQQLLDQVITSSVDLYNPIEDILYYKESEALLRQAIEELPAQQRMVFTLCKIDGKSYEEVSQLLKISTSTVSNHIVRATKSIKKVFFNSKSGFLLLALSLLHNKM